MNRPQPLAISILVSSLVLSACGVIGEPSLDTAASLCANGEKAEVTIGLDFSDPATSPYVTEPGRNNGDYRLYLQDILEAAEPSEAISVDIQNALTSISDLVNGDADDQFGLNYEMAGGLVVSADNPLVYIESLLASTDSNTQIGAFQDARTQISGGISADDDFCNYTNSNIRFVDQDSNTVLFSELNLSYNPFTRIVQQSFLISELREAFADIEQRQTVPYFGFAQANSSNFQTRGFYPFTQRSTLANSPDGFRSLLVDDGKDLSLGQIEISTSNTFCEDVDGEVTACDSGPTRAPAKAQSDGSDPDEQDETGVLQERALALDSSITNLKRIRLETDYATQEVRIYASEYNEAILDSDGVTEIFDPTNCEKQAVLDELAIASPGVGVRLTIVEDPNYDLIYDEDNVLITAPLYTFAGTDLPE